MKAISYFLLMGCYVLLPLIVPAQNNCLSFDGTDDYVNVSSFTPTLTQGTISFWIRLDQIPANNARILSRSWLEDEIFIDGNAGTINTYSLVTGNDLQSETALSAGVWTHICITADASGSKLYINGVPDDEGGAADFSLSSFRFGGQFTSAYEVLPGKLDELRFWNDIRTETEIRQNMYRELPDPSTEANLVSYYKLDETDGSFTANDSKGSNNGALTNMTGNEWETSSAIFGPKNCLDFDGASDYVATDNLFISGNTFTLEAWIYARTFNGSGDANISQLIVGGDENALLRIGDAGIDNNQPQFVVLVGGAHQRLDANTHMAANRWYHMAGVYDGSSMKLYINGMLDNSLAQSGNIDETTNTLILAGNTDNTRMLDGRMDEVRIWSNARTAEQIRENMCKNLTGNESGLLAYFSFDNSSGTVLQDFSGNDKDGTLTHMANDDWVGSDAYNTWLNTTDNSWRTTSNWSLGSYPTTGHNTGVYNYGGSSVQPSYSANIECRNLVIGANADIAFSNPLDVDENFLVNSDFDIPDNCGMRVDKAVITSGKTLTVRPGGMIDIYSGIVNEGTFLLESTSSGTGSVVADGTYSGSGSYEIQRYIAQWTGASHGWHFLSSPVSAQAIQPDFVSDPPTVNEDFYSWDEPTNYWINTKAGDGSWNSSFESTFTVGKGYLVAYGSDQTKSFSGTWNNSNVSITNLTHTLTSENRGWHLLGNPFPCGVIWTWDIEWDPNWQQQYIGSTAKIWQESSASYTDIDDNEIIPPMQGFMVYVAENQTGSLIIPKALRSHETDVWYKSTGVNTLKLTVHDVEYHTAQETVIRFIPEASQGYDIAYDCWYLPGYAPQFYTQTEGKAASTNGLPELHESIQIPLYFIKNEGTQFYIRVEGTDDLDPDLPVFLTDLQTHTTHNLTNEPIYSFTAIEGDDPGRFLLHFSTVGIGEEQFAGSAINMLAWNGGNTLHIINPEQLPGQFTVFDITGKPVLLGILDGESEQSYSHNLPGSLYVVCFRTSEGVVSRKVLVAGYGQ